MKITAAFEKNGNGEVTATLILERGGDDPNIVSIDGMARSFAQGSKMEVPKTFGRHQGKDAKDWSDNAIADIRHQIEEFRTSVPKDYSVEI
jgi:hypothetical protein